MRSASSVCVCVCDSPVCVCAALGCFGLAGFAPKEASSHANPAICRHRCLRLRSAVLPYCICTCDVALLCSALGFWGSQEDRDLVARLRPFARFSEPKEHDELIDNLLVAKKIR